jgi:Animal haem peroxidase
VQPSQTGAPSAATAAPAEQLTAEPPAEQPAAALSTQQRTAASPSEQSAAASPSEQSAAESPSEQSAAESPSEQSAAESPSPASPVEQPVAPAPSAEPAQSLVAQEGATPDAPFGDSRSAPNSAGSALTNPSGSASAPSANAQSTVVVRAAATSVPPAEALTATEAVVESVPGISSAVQGAPEAQAVAQTVSDPSAPPDPVTEVVSKVLASVGLNPFASDHPVAPVDSPAMWAMLAWARRRAEEAQPPSSFGRMFPVGVTAENGEVLEPLNQQTNDELAELAQEMLEGTPAIDNPKGTAAGITFFGQFIDHDLTLDNEPQPAATVDVEGLVNGRTFAFDLDSVYGGGPKKSPQLYDGDKFLIGTATDGVSPDLPRNDKGTAILVEPRNDENLIISQIHVSFLRLHNSLIDQGMSFDEARQTVVGAYRHVVLNDYLPQIVGQKAVNQALRRPTKAGFYQPGSQNAPMTPVEFSTAAFRFGHSQVRNAYAINDTSGGVPVFSFDEPDLRGGRQLPADLIIDFNNFFSELPRGSLEDPALIGRAIDTKISQSLFQLPIPGAEATGDNVLAFRNLVRGKFYDLPSGEAIAEAMGVEVVGEEPEFPEGTPLWYYVLREAELTSGGAELGPVGGGIVAEVFVDLLRLDSGYETIEKPKLPDVSGGDFRIGDLLVAADQPQIDEPSPPAEQPTQEGSGRHRLHEQLQRAEDFARERTGRHRLHQQLHGADN